VSIVIRRAREADQEGLAALMKGERVRPYDRRWQNFLVAEQDQRLVGAIQLRSHRDGSLEMGSLVVAPHIRGGRLAVRLIDTLMKSQTGRVFAITRRTRAAFFARLGFERVPMWRAPVHVSLQFALGQLAGLFIAPFQRRRPQRLAIFERPATTLPAAIKQTAGRSHICAE